MKKIYCEGFIVPNNEQAKDVLLKLALTERDMIKRLDMSEHANIIVGYHNQVREYLKLPNKLFAFGIAKDEENVRIVLFPMEPDGKYYKPAWDAEKQGYYILVEETEV